MNQTYEQNIDDEIRAFYVTQSPITAPGEHSDMFSDLPDDLTNLCKAVQGAMIHIFWADRYGLDLPESRKAEVQLRYVSKILSRLKELDSSQISEPRPLAQRLVGNCRDFSVMLCSILRSKGISARARCGFATYFNPGKYEDHWICEYWNIDESRWVRVDMQLDELQCHSLHIDFNPTDVPAGKFLPGGKAWQLCRFGYADPNLFGIFDMRGMNFIKGDLVRDIASLNKVELLPWDCWGIIETEYSQLSDRELQQLDALAELTLSFDTRSIQAIRQAYQSDKSIRVSSIITSYRPDGPKKIELFGL